MSLFTELKRRKVVRVALVYGASAFAVLQAADILMPALHLPAWTVTLVVILIALGFPIALVLGWALELTPEGVRVTPVAPVQGMDDASPALLGRRTLAVTALLVAAGLGLGAGLVLAPEPVSRAAGLEDDDALGTAASKSIAVLPFADLSESGDQKWFADGLAEEILNRLARLGELRVSARNSSFRFEDRSVDVREIGRQLGVANVVEGSVRRDGDRLRIGIQLVRARDGFQLWSQSYDRHLDDVFAIQADIAENIARALDVVLAG